MGGFDLTVLESPISHRTAYAKSIFDGQTVPKVDQPTKQKPLTLEDAPVFSQRRIRA